MGTELTGSVRLNLRPAVPLPQGRLESSMPESSSRKQMRILVVHEFNFRFGGGEQYLYEICHALREMGHRVALVCARDKNQGYLPVDVSYGIERSFGLRTGRRVFPFVRQVLDQERPDLLFLNGLGCLFLSPHIIGKLVAGWPTVAFVHHLDLICPTGRKIIPKADRPCGWAAGHHCLREGCVGLLDASRVNALRRALVALWRMRVLRRSGMVIVPSEFVRRECLRNGFAPGRLQILPPFTPKGRGPLPDPVGHRILWAGRLEDGKGLDHFLRSLRRLPGRGWEALVVGEGPGRAKAMELAAALGLSQAVTFLGRLDGDELDTAYASSRLLVMTSTWAETFGQVGIEAMAFGRPVVAYDAGGTTEWLEDGRTGFLVQRGDCVRLAERVTLLLEDDLLWRRMGTAALQEVERRFRPEQHVQGLVQAFEVTIRASRGETIDLADVA